MPNTIAPGDLANLSLPECGRHLQLKQVGWVRPIVLGSACEAVVDDVSPCALYCEIVDGHAMKFGTAGSVRSRQKRNQGTINNILAFRDGRYLGKNEKITKPSNYDKYKRLAPKVIRSGERIEIWATALSSHVQCQHPLKKLDGRCAACKDVEGALNDRYKTIECGWASLRN
ncbi:MAG: hypothetical protein ABJA98_22905 [Acidobacteriota bacterium]